MILGIVFKNIKNFFGSPREFIILLDTPGGNKHKKIISTDKITTLAHKTLQQTPTNKCSKTNKSKTIWKQ